MKPCTICKEVKSLVFFHRHPAMADGYRNQCIECKKVYIAEYQKTPQARLAQKSRTLKYSYGITLADKQKMFDSQEGNCASCGDVMVSVFKAHLDHHHASGKIRDLLCGGCNAALGYLKEDPDRIMKLATYIKKHQSEGT